MAAIGLAAVGARWTGAANPIMQILWTILYWSVLFSGVVVGMTLLYRFGSSRSRVRWRWVTWGSILAAVAWLAMSGTFTFYVSRFGNYDETYGTLGATIGFMTWTWLSSIVFLMGAELNAEIEHQTAKDTTTGTPRRLGLRGAVMADTVGEAR
ncbi:YihY family inner membrane protein [Brevundimonas sp. 1080]